MQKIYAVTFRDECDDGTISNGISQIFQSRKSATEKFEIIIYGEVIDHINNYDDDEMPLKLPEEYNEEFEAKDYTHSELRKIVEHFFDIKYWINNEITYQNKTTKEFHVVSIEEHFLYA